MKDQILLLISSLGMSQKDFAKSIDIGPGRINDLINGRTKELSAEYIRKIATVHNVDPYWLLTGEGDMTLNRESVASPRVSPSEAQVLHLLRESPELQPVVIAFLKGSKSLKELVEAAERLPEGQRATALKLVRALG